VAISGHPDVIVVGGGAAGCVVAARLSEDPACEVLLIEAGPDLRGAMPEDIRSGWRPTRSFDWGLASEPDAAGVSRPLPRGKLLGGCSSTNATFALRGSPHDYDRWALAGAQGWAFSEVLPYFVRVERDLDFGDAAWHGDSGPLPIRRYGATEMTDVSEAALAALVDSGFPPVPDHNAPGAVGAGPLPVNCLGGMRVSAALAFLPEHGARPNLRILGDGPAASVVLDGLRAAGVRMASGETVRAERIVLCAGTYGTPPLLLRSGIGDPDALGRLGIRGRIDLPGVGRGLIDHPGIAISVPVVREPPPLPVHQVVATARSSRAGADDPPDLQVFPFGPYPSEAEAGPLMFVAAALLTPRSRGAVELRSADPGDPPRITLGYFDEPEDLDRLMEGLERAEAIARHPALGRLTPAGGDGATVPPLGVFERRGWIRAHAWTYHHPVGTCAMGREDDPRAVVDPGGRVIGIESLTVADASIMPDIPSANTHLPTLMIAERVAEGLHRDLTGRGHATGASSNTPT
jgi:choline dehydrogenase-like flavoprotein